MEGLPLTQLTHGDGAAMPGDLDDGADDDGVESASLPSAAPTNASGMPGDLSDDCGDHPVITPQWTGSASQTCSYGSWESEHVKASDHGGNFGLLTANWVAICMNQYYRRICSMT